MRQAWKKAAGLILPAILAAAVAAGCSAVPEEVSSSAPADTQEFSAAAASVEGQPGSTQGFEEVFAQNPIDAAYQEEEVNALTNQEMLQLSQKYADVWETEVEWAYQALVDAASGEAKSQYEEEQVRWPSERQSKLEEIASAAGTGGGSLAGLTQATQTMEFYRERAKELYEQLYQYQPDYSYAYSSAASSVNSMASTLS